MKVVISATGRDKDSMINETFGRAPFFLIVDTKTLKEKVLVNTVQDRPNSVGITVGNMVAQEEIDAVIASDIGPHVYATFEQCGIKMYHAKGNITDALQRFSEGKLPEKTKKTALKYSGLKKEHNAR